jgi:hypothetical protein
MSKPVTYRRGQIIWRDIVPVVASAVIIALFVSPIPALATNYHDYHPWGRPQAQAQTRSGYAGPVSLQHYYVASPRSGN